MPARFRQPAEDQLPLPEQNVGRQIVDCHYLELASDIASAFGHRDSVKALTDDKFAVRRAKELAQVEKYANKLIELLGHEGLSAALGPHSPLPSKWLAQLAATLQGLKQIEIAAGKELVRRQKLGLHERAVMNIELPDPDNWDPGVSESLWSKKEKRDWTEGWKDARNKISESVSDALIIELAKIFRKHFDIDHISFSYPAAAPPGGPFVAFVQKIGEITNKWREQEGRPKEKFRGSDAIKKAIEDRSTNRDKS